MHFVVGLFFVLFLKKKYCLKIPKEHNVSYYITQGICLNPYPRDISEWGH